MKVGGDNDHYSYIADNYNHMTFLCKGKCRRYKQFFICFYKGASLRRYYPGQVIRVKETGVGHPIFLSQQNSAPSGMSVIYPNVWQYNRFREKCQLSESPLASSPSA